MNANYSYSTYESFLNTIKSPVQEQFIRGNLVIENREKETWDIAVGIQVDYNSRDFLLQQNFNQQFITNKYFIDADWFIAKDWVLSSSYDFYNYSDEFFSSGSQFNLWNASLTKVFKENKWQLSLIANDLLQQNIGLVRSGGLNGLYEQRFNTLTRYFLLSVKYKIGKKKKKS